MADDHPPTVAHAGKSQAASFGIQDILRNSTSFQTTMGQESGNKFNGHIVQTMARKESGRTAAKRGSLAAASKKSESGKRIRTIFSQEQLDILEANFERQQYMIRSERTQLAATLNLQEAQVKVWFQNRRIKWRKQQHETTMARIRSYQESGSGRAAD